MARYICFELPYSSGILAAAWVAQDPGFRFGSMILLIIPVSIGGMFAIASTPVSNSQARQTNLEIQAQNELESPGFQAQE